MESYCNLAKVYVEERFIDIIHKGENLKIETLTASTEIAYLTQNADAKNSYVLLRGLCDSKKTVLCKITSDRSLKKIIDTRDKDLLGVSPKDAKQSCFVDALFDDSTLLTCAIGPAGTGKSTLALAYGLPLCLSKKKKLYMSKSTALVGRGRTFGAVPGDVRDKYGPHVSSYQIILKKLLGDKSDSYLKILEEKDQMQYIPIEYARGATFENCTFIIDEVQNLTWHELKTICSRMGEGAKLVLLGDLEQIDLNIKPEESGIYKLISSQGYTTSEIAAQVYLDQQYRGPIPTLMSDVDKELKSI